MNIFSKIFSNKKAEQKQSERDLIADGFPKFKYYANPIKTKAFVKSQEECEICGKKTGYVYNNEFYAVEDVESICPWCIASGAAAQKYEGTFHDFEIEDSNLDGQKVAELMERTPGFECMQPGIWPCHCEDICVFIDHVDWKDVVKLGIVSELEDDLEKIREEFGCENEDIGKLFRNEGLCGYLFKCLGCGKYRLTVDID